MENASLLCKMSLKHAVSFSAKITVSILKKKKRCFLLSNSSLGLEQQAKAQKGISQSIPPLSFIRFFHIRVGFFL